jgi:uncharacterized protein YhaN
VREIRSPGSVRGAARKGRPYRDSHEGLVEGGRALLEGKGDVGESLFSAGLGGLGIHHLLRRLEEQAEEIFKPKGKNQPLNRAISAFKEAKKLAQEQSLQTKDWDLLQKDLREQRALSNKLDATLHALRAEERRLRRIQSALGPVAHREEIDKQLAEQSGVILLPETAAEERRTAERILADAAPAEARLANEIEDLDQKQARLAVPDELLSREAALNQLTLDLGSHIKAASDLPRRRAELRVLEDEARSILRGLAPALALEEVETLRLRVTVETRLRTLVLQRAKIESALTAAVQGYEDRKDKLQSERRKLEALAAPPNTERLRRAADHARAEGALEKRFRDQEIAGDIIRDAVTRGHASLGLWTGPIDSIGALAVPSSESIDRFASSAATFSRDLAAEAKRADERRAKLAQFEQQLDALTRGTSMVTEEDLAEARRRRDRRWSLVRRAWLGGEVVDDAAEAAVGAALAAEHEQETRTSDDVADRLRRESDRSAHFASVLAGRAAEEKELGESARRREALEAEQQADLDRWRALWLPIGVEPLSPAEMRGWLLRYGKLIDERTRWSEALRTRDDLQAALAAHVQALSAALADSGRATAGEGESLAALLGRADRALAEADALARERSRLVAGIFDVLAETDKLKGAADKQAAALETWRRDWLEITAALDLSPAALPEEAEEIVKQRKELLAKADALRVTRRRVDTMEEDARAFAARVDELVQGAAPDVTASSVEQRAEALLTRFHDGGKNRVERDQLARRHKDATTELRDLVRTREQAQHQLARLVTQAGCASALDLPDAERRSDEVRKLKQDRATVETQLRNLSEGMGIEALVAESRDHDGDEVFAKLRTGESDIEAAERARKEPEQAIGKLEARLDEMNGGDRAAVAAESVQQELARIRLHVEDYARARLAGVLLREEINRYRERNQGPIVRRASELFQLLTLHTFSRLEIAYDEQDNAVIRCVRADDRRVDVDGLSDGTRDQLFLALRIASMERHQEGNEPVPVIVDDILINFDDRRATAALAVLGNLAARTQVLFFTHHRHLADLAHAAVAGAPVVRHDLDALAGWSVP